MVVRKGKPVLICEVYESKTKHYKRGIWVKHIFDVDIHAEFQRRAKQSGQLFTTTRARRREIATRLRAKYRQHGLTAKGQLVRGDAETAFCVRKPFHLLRHLGAQRTLRATGWNIAYVAKRGWKTAQELTDSYGEMPPEMELAAMDSVAF